MVVAKYVYIKKMKLKSLDLFAGIGGMRIGLEQALKRLNIKHDCVMASDIDKYAKETYLNNFPSTPFIGDISELNNVNKIKKIIPKHNLLLAGFPCQPFSRAGHKKGLEDTRGTLFYYIAKILSNKKPDAFILENVRGLKEHDKGRTLEIMLKVLRKKYLVPDPKVLNSKDFGLPQNRARIFIVGIRKDLYKKEFIFPIGNKKKTNVGQILEKRVDKGFQISDRLWESHVKRKERNKKNGKGFGYSLFDKHDPYTRTLSARYNKDGSEILIKTKKNPRKLTPRECANLQGFPKSFKLTVSNAQSYKQFGNAVSVNVVENLSKSLIESLYSIKN